MGTESRELRELVSLGGVIRTLGLVAMPLLSRREPEDLGASSSVSSSSFPSSSSLCCCWDGTVNRKFSCDSLVVSGAGVREKQKVAEDAGSSTWVSFRILSAFFLRRMMRVFLILERAVSVVRPTCR